MAAWQAVDGMIVNMAINNRRQRRPSRGPRRLVRALAGVVVGSALVLSVFLVARAGAHDLAWYEPTHQSNSDHTL
jgi:hypothetical protein